MRSEARRESIRAFEGCWHNVLKRPQAHLTSHPARWCTRAAEFSSLMSLVFVLTVLGALKLEG